MLARRPGAASKLSNCFGPITLSQEMVVTVSLPLQPVLGHYVQMLQRQGSKVDVTGEGLSCVEFIISVSVIFEFGRSSQPWLW